MPEKIWSDDSSMALATRASFLEHRATVTESYGRGKSNGSRTNGLCAYRDALRPILEKCQKADAIVIGSPVYFDYPTAQTRAFLERFLFPLDTYMVKEGSAKGFG
jgi:multimeric flavodoxin WrbA